MILSAQTKELLSKIQTTSGNTLQRAMDLGALLEISLQHNKKTILDDLAFHSKFLVKTFELMKRIGKEGDGYEKLYKEFSASLEKSRQMILQILENAPNDVKTLFSSQYLSLSTISMEQLMQLIHDISWYKNYLIDMRSAQ